MMRSLIAAILAPALLAAPALAAENHPKVADGADLYGEFCSQCHGPEMRNPVGKAYHLRKYPTDRPADFKRTVLAGKGDMPAWDEVLTGEEIDAIWVYVATHGGEQALPVGADAAFGPKDDYLPTETATAAPAWDGEPTEHPLYDEGRSLYRDMCSHCHGIEMRNAGTSSYDLRKYPRDKAAEFKLTVQKGKGDMPAWGDILAPGEIDALWVYVATRGGKEKFPGGAQPEDGKKSAAPSDDRNTAASGPLLRNGTLRVCLALNGGAMSRRRATGGSGFDYAVALELARRLDSRLEVAWFESEQDEYSDPVPEAYAMLAADKCDLVPAHPVMPGTTGAPPAARAALPRFDVDPTIVRVRRHGPDHVDLAPAEATAPYMRTGLALVRGPGVEPGRVTDLNSLAGLRVGVEQGTLSEAILRRQAPAEAMADAVTFNPGATFLWEMETGKFDVTLIDLAAYDFHLRQNPVSKIALTGYRHPFGVNIAMLVAADRPALREATSAAIREMRSDGTIAELARQEKVTWIPPEKASSPISTILGR